MEDLTKSMLLYAKEPEPIKQVIPKKPVDVFKHIVEDIPETKIKPQSLQSLPSPPPPPPPPPKPKTSERNLSADIQLIKQNTRNLKNIEDQTQELCELAVKIDWRALMFVKDKNEKICELAIKINIKAIKLCPFNEELFIRAIKHDWKAIQYIAIQTENICMEAVKCTGWALQYILHPSYDVIYTALSNDIDSFRHIKHKTLPILSLYRMKKHAFYNKQKHEETNEDTTLEADN